MKKIIIIFFLLTPLLLPSQYNRHYKEPKKISKGAILTIGGLTFTAAPLISDITRYGKPFPKKTNHKGLGISPNTIAFGCGVTVTIVGLITLIAEHK